MKSKILTIFCIIMLLSSFILINNVYAANYDLSDYKNYTSGKNWMIFHTLSDNTFYLIVLDSGYLYTNGLRYEDNGNCLIGSCVLASNDLTTNPWGSPKSFNVYKFNNSSNKFEHLKNTTEFSIEHSYLIASNVTIRYAGNHSDFFQATPVPSVVHIASTTLAKELETVQVTKVWKTLMKTLVVSLIVFLVGLVGLRKAWTFLKTALRKA